MLALIAAFVLGVVSVASAQRLATSKPPTPAAKRAAERKAAAKKAATRRAAARKAAAEKAAAAKAAAKKAAAVKAAAAAKVYASYPATLARGETLFKANCARCHTLSAANTHGTVGPDLDGDNVSYSDAVYQITNGDSIMPGFGGTLTTGQIHDIATFVAHASSE